MKKKLVLICTNDFLNNTSGGGQVFLNNLKTLENFVEYLPVFVFDFKNLKVESYLYKNSQLNFLEKYISLPRIFFRYNTLILKFLTFFKLSLKYDLIWCEHYYSLPFYRITPMFIFNKIIYSQHDFLFKIKSLKDGNKRDKLFVEEKKTINKCKFMIAGNQVEVDFAKEIFNAEAFYLPISIDRVWKTAIDQNPSVVHLGSFNTTASRLGFEHFYKDVKPMIKTPFKTILIGENSNLTDFKDIYGMGYVDDLSVFLKMGTINVIPWKYSTGHRTRVFQSLARGNVIVSYKVLGDIIPELNNLQNCILVNSEADFADAIDKLLNNTALRTSIAFEAFKLAKELTIQKRVAQLEKIMVNFP
jgi:glycosyltransferase involved in cell wall biosynthesis